MRLSTNSNEVKMARSDADGQMQEFLLHARSIHLTIAATAFLLFAAMLGVPASDLKIARRDLERMQIALKSGEVDKLVQKAYLLAGRGPGLWKSKFSGTYAWQLDFREGDRTRTVLARLYHQGLDAELPLEEQLIPRVAPGDKGASETCDTIVRPDRLAYRFETKVPDRPSLSDARRLWNCLARLQVGNVINVSYDRASPIPLVEHLTNNFPNNFISARPRTADRQGFADHIAKQAIPAMFVEEYDKFPYLEYSPGAAETGDVVDPAKLAKTPYAFVVGETTANANQILYTIPIRIPLSMRFLPLDVQSLLIEEFFPGVRPGEFDRRFKTLSEWSGTRANRPIDVLLEDIESEMEKSADTLELFGAKVPFKAVAVVGTILVSILQCYLAFHLKHLLMAFPTVEAIPPVPWIGAMQGRWPKAMTLASTVLLPTVVVAVLLARGYDTVGWITTIIMFAVALGAGGFLWRTFNQYWAKILRPPPLQTIPG
jgi:hypothetical protein